MKRDSQWELATVSMWLAGGGGFDDRRWDGGE